MLLNIKPYRFSLKLAIYHSICTLYKKASFNSVIASFTYFDHDSENYLDTAKILISGFCTQIYYIVLCTPIIIDYTGYKKFTHPF